jgi:hypothetical protein
MSRLRPVFFVFLYVFVFFTPALIATAPHTWLSHGCHMDAMLKPRNRLAAPTAPVLQAGSPGIWLPNLFECSFTHITSPIKVM